jgi:hypothetical protein
MQVDAVSQRFIELYYAIDTLCNIYAYISSSILGAWIAQSIYWLGCGKMRKCDSVSSRAKRSVSFQNNLDWLWGPPSHLFSGWQGTPLQGWSDWGMKSTMHFHLEQRLRMSGVLPPLPLCLRGMYEDRCFYFTRTNRRICERKDLLNYNVRWLESSIQMSLILQKLYLMIDTTVLKHQLTNLPVYLNIYAEGSSSYWCTVH